MSILSHFRQFNSVNTIGILLMALTAQAMAGPLPDGRYVVISRNSGLAIDMQGASKDDGANVYQWTIHRQENQQFDLMSVDGSYYIIKSVNSGKVLDVASFSKENGGNIHQWTQHGQASQQFRLESVDSGYYGILSRHSGKALDVTQASKEVGANIQQWDWLKTANQQWRFESVATARFTSASSFVARSAFQIEVVPNPINDVQTVELFVNGQFLRTESTSRYEWGGANAADGLLKSLPAGKHSLRAVITYASGAKVEATQQLTLTSAVGSKPASSKPASSKPASSKPASSIAPSSKPASSKPVSSVAPSSTPASSKPASSKPASSLAASSRSALPAGATLWSDPNTWGGQVPAENASVTIPSGRTVYLDRAVTVGNLTVNGTLRCLEKTNLALTADWIMVHGTFECGTQQKPFNNRFVITLRGQPSDPSIMGMGTKLLGAMGSGRINIHGEERTSWTRLAKTAMPGDTVIRLSDAPNWRVGDRIVLASTSEKVDENEVRTITNVSSNDITLNQPLTYRHFGERQTFSNGKDKVWDVETRGEVALLSRNILIQGDAASQNATKPTEGFGGHIMVMMGSEAYISGIELYRMGQTGILGRYPFHWHLAGDVSGQFITNSSIHQSYNRCVTVHGSHNAFVQNNVCFNHLGHGYFLEDGFETGNVFDRNLAIRTHKPAENVALLPSDTQGGKASRGPSSFWISNPDNTFTNNVAVGSDGLGFWFDTEDKVAQPSLNAFPESGSVNPTTTPLGKFDDNLVHSSSMGLSLCSESSGHKGYQPSKQAPAVYNRFTAYNAGDGGIWPCQDNHVFNDFRMLDTGKPGDRTGTFVSPDAMTVQNSLFVANSKLTSPAQKRVAVGMYDQGVYFKNVHFEGYNFTSDSSVFQANGGSQQFASSRIENNTFKDSPFIYRGLPASFSNLNSIVHDVDGSLGFGPNSVIVPTQSSRSDTRIYTTPECAAVALNPGIYLCPNSFASMDVWVYDGNTPLKDEEMTVRNSQGVEFTSGHGPVGVIPWVSVLVPLNAQGTNRELTYILPADTWTKADRVRFQIDRGKPGPNQVAYFIVKDVPSTVKFKGTNMKLVNSVDSVKATANSWYRSGSTLYVAIKLNGTEWAETKADESIEW